MCMRSRRRGGLRLAAVDGFVDASRFGSGTGVGGGLRSVGWRGAAAAVLVKGAVDRLRLGGLRAAAAAPGERARASVAYSWRSARHKPSWTRSWSWCPSGTRRSALGRADCIDAPAIYLSTLLRISLMHERRCRRPSTVSERAILSKNTRGAMLCVCEVLSNIVLKPVFYLKK